MNYIRAYRQATGASEAGSPIRFVASTQGIKRDGRELLAENWRLDNYRQNPVVLWVHDYMGGTLPIGRAEVQVADTELLADVVFDQEDEFARAVESKYRRGFLNAVSVGWQDEDEGSRSYYDLMDISAVPVPADPQALKMHQARALMNVNQLILDEFGEEHSIPVRFSDVDVWEGISAAMVGLFSPESAMEEELRQGLYVVLERAYRKLGRVAPEYRPLDELVALSDVEVAGLFLENELTSARRSMAASNRADLEQIGELVRGLLARVESEPEEENERNAEYQDAEQLRALHRLLTGE
jgi:hypothetical protein